MGVLDRRKMMAYGQLRLWAAGEPACESETWPQAFFLLFDRPFIGNRSKFNVLSNKLSEIDRNRRNSVENSSVR